MDGKEPDHPNLCPDFFYLPSDFSETVNINPRFQEPHSYDRYGNTRYNSGCSFVEDFYEPDITFEKKLPRFCRVRDIIFEIYSRALKTASTLAKLQNVYGYIFADIQLEAVEKEQLVTLYQEKYKAYSQLVEAEIDDLD